MALASGACLDDLDIDFDSLKPRGVAVQCRITTEDPSDDFSPSAGKLVVYRSASGPGVRLDGATYMGAEIQPFLRFIVG